jgi:hypothetical protein
MIDSRVVVFAQFYGDEGLAVSRLRDVIEITFPANGELV